jgi:hypothetical protein
VLALTVARKLPNQEALNKGLPVESRLSTAAAGHPFVPVICELSLKGGATIVTERYDITLLLLHQLWNFELGHFAPLCNSVTVVTYNFPLL